jgi:hypothetical protein
MHYLKNTSETKGYERFFMLHHLTGSIETVLELNKVETIANKIQKRKKI